MGVFGILIKFISGIMVIGLRTVPTIQCIGHMSSYTNTYLYTIIFKIHLTFLNS